MFRVASLALHARSFHFIYRRSPVGIPLASVTPCRPLRDYKQITEREPCPPPPPPPPPPPKDDRFFWGTMALMFLAGGFAYYAKQNPEVRDWLTINLPWYDDFIAVLYQENMTYKEFAQQCIDEIKEYFLSYFEDNRPKKCSSDGTPIPTVEKGPKTKEICGEEGESLKCAIPPPLQTNDICDVEQCLRDLGDTIVNNYITAKDACIYYNKLVEETMTDFNIPALKELHKAKAEREELVSASVENIDVASKKLDSLIKFFECGVQAPPQAIELTRTLIKTFSDRMNTLAAEYQWQNDISLALDQLWQKVETTVLKYTEELTTLVPGVKFDKKSNLTGDPDLLLHHTNRYVSKLLQELEEASAAMTERADRGLASLSQSPKDVQDRKYALQVALKQKRWEMDRDYRKRLDDQKLANNNILKEALKKQLERHEETLQTRLVQKEKEALAKLNKLVTEKVAAEKKIFNKQLHDMAMKLKVVEDKLNERLKAERETRRSQELWTAGASLLAATKKGDPLVKVDKELKAIEKASGDGDQLVMTVLKAIPESVRRNGVVPESVLRERYHKMEKVALNVALVEAEGAPLPIFIFSWIQSMFLFMKLSGIPQNEIDKPPEQPPEHLDTFDLLQRARFWLERGNLSAALRHVGALQGASRAAAARWLEAARSHLETRQAAEAVLAHAAALGLQYV